MSKRFYWTLEKEEDLRKLWGKESLSKLTVYFHTIPETILKKAEELGLESYNSGRWTKEEEELLKEYSKKYLTKTIAKKLGRSYLAVQKKAVKLGIELHSESDPWKKWMIDYLKDNINKRPIGEICSILNLSYGRVLTKCKELGIEYVKTDWTKEEIDTLRKYADKCHYTELVKVLPNRSIGAISAKAYELGIQTISDYHKTDEKTAQYIKNNWGVIPATEIARNLKISIGIVYRYKKELNLPNVGQHKKWTDQKIEKLRKDATVKTREQLAKKYNTSVVQISAIAKKNGIELKNSRKIWTDELNEQLFKLVDEGLSIIEISKIMKIKANTIRCHLKNLDSIKYKQSKQVLKTWTDEEIEKLKEMTKTFNIVEIANKLNKTEKQISGMCSKLGIKVISDKNYYWKEEEIKTLINLSDIYERDMIAKIMNRTEENIKKKAQELNISLKIRKPKYWTVEEEKLLKKYAQEFDSKGIAYLLNRSVASIDSKLNCMGLKAQPAARFWTAEEIKNLEELAKVHSIEEIANIMNKSYNAIAIKVNELNIDVVNKANKSWSEEEDLRLLEFLTTYSSFEVAKMLNRSEETIIARAIKLGYQIDAKNRNWTKEEETLLSDLWGQYSIDYIAKKLNRTVSAITNRAFILKLGAHKDSNYEGLTIKEIENIFGVHRNVILTSWVSLGLKLSFQKVSDQNIYAYVKISDLYEFLEIHKDFWNSKCLEKNILGKEPEWLINKRIQDKDNDIINFQIENLSKAQLILAKQYFLENQDVLNENQEHEKQKIIEKN